MRNVPKIASRRDVYKLIKGGVWPWLPWFVAGTLTWIGLDVRMTLLAAAVLICPVLAIWRKAAAERIFQILYIPWLQASILMMLVLIGPWDWIGERLPRSLVRRWN